MTVLTCDQVRRIDQLAVERYGVPSIVLMENAGRGLTDHLLACLHATGDDSNRKCSDQWNAMCVNAHANDHQQPCAVTICCGKGNNGGDGFVIARRLVMLSIPVHVFAMGSPDAYTGDARVNLGILDKLRSETNLEIHFIAGTAEGVPPDLRQLQSCLRQSCWAVDALLGTGAKGNPRSPVKEVIEALNCATDSTAGKNAVKIYSVDIPSGLNADTGEVYEPVVHASATGTMAAFKPGLINPCAPVVGDLRLIDLGIPIPKIL